MFLSFRNNVGWEAAKMKRKNKYILLEFLLAGMGIISFLIMRLQQKCINFWKTAAAKNRALFMLMDQWTYIKQEGKNLQTYFMKKKYNKIAVYGMGDAGRRLVKELKHSEVEILYGIDRNARNIHSDIKIITIEDDLPVVDAVVVTLIDGYDEAFDILSEKINCPIIAIEDILNEI